MLTSTYALATFSVEQAAIRKGLCACQEHVQSRFIGQDDLEQHALISTLDSLDRLHQRCRLRKLEIYLIPAIREATRAADSLLAELDALAVSGLAMLANIRQRVMQAEQDGNTRPAPVCTAMLTYCTSQLRRLEKEEIELFAIARKTITRDTWFALAQQILLNEKRPALQSVVATPRGATASGLTLVKRQGHDGAITHAGGKPGLQAPLCYDDMAVAFG